MSVELKYYAGSGICLDLSKVVTRGVSRQRACDHDIAEDQVYCSVCGKKVWCEYGTEVLAFELPDYDYDKEEDAPIDDALYGYFEQRGLSVWYNEEVVFIGIGNKVEDSPLFCPSDELSKIEALVMQHTEPLHLWDKERFGFWALRQWC